MGAKTGSDCIAYRNTGTYGTPVWNPWTNLRDLSLNLEMGDADASYRGSNWKRTLATMKDGSVDAEMIHDPLVDDYNVIRDAFINKTVLDLAIADGAIATVGTQYFRADFQAFGFSRNEPLEDTVTVKVPLKISYSTNEPGFTTVP